MTPAVAYLMLVGIGVATFVLSGLWWLSGHRGGSMGEPGPIGVALFVTALAALVFYLLGWIP